MKSYEKYDEDEIFNIGDLVSLMSLSNKVIKSKKNFKNNKIIRGMYKN